MGKEGFKCRMRLPCEINAVKLHYPIFPPCLSNHLSNTSQNISSDPNPHQQQAEKEEFILQMKHSGGIFKK